ncbi:hypothetical protein BSKO_00486 [Bryopsis sp. KO-2023]|nr:hypothetical protein BSKO_00486 [Bryopsis sp. KO-2023]
MMDMRKPTVLPKSDIVPGHLPDPCFVPAFVEDADVLFARLRDELKWNAKYRWNLFYKLPQAVFHYKVKQRRTKPIALLEDIIERVERLHNAKASDVWCNLFRDGKDHIEWHQDQYGEHLTTLSLGAPRLFQLRPISRREDVSEIELNHGDLYTWSPETDKKHEHCVPAAPAMTSPRISVVVWTQPPGSGL